MNKRTTYKNYGIIIICILLLIAWLAYSIDKEKASSTSLNGIFSLKLGMTEKELRGVVDESKLSQLKTEEFNLTDIELKSFILDSYKVSDVYSLDKLQLDFLNDTLYAIIIREYNEQTESLLTEKYKLENVEIDLIRGKQNRYEERRWNSYNYNVECYSFYFVYEDVMGEYALVIRDKKKRRSLSEMQHKDDRIQNKHNKLIDAL